MLTPPEDLPPALIAEALGRQWGIAAGSLSYRPVGWGSHHWVADQDSRWFITVDDLETKRHAVAESLDDPYGRLRTALIAAVRLRSQGRTFVVAPHQTNAGEPCARLGARYAVAVYPYIEGESFGWGEFQHAGHRDAVLDLLAQVHSADVTALSDDFVVPQRGELVAAFVGPAPDAGPYARPAQELLRANRVPLERLLHEYDELVRHAAGRRRVLTHGEPHPGNTMLGPDGWLLIDWDTVLLAPPERDLWSLGADLRTYVDATGVEPDPSMMDLYRLRWDLADVAVDAARFRRPHTGTVEDDKTWEIVSALVRRLCT